MQWGGGVLAAQLREPSLSPLLIERMRLIGEIEPPGRDYEQ